ncbi:MAG: SiaC family regulatory phosphoprotein, partial [Bacteroidia bacterium]|nr:SiaC family regulatory phosphoprotein [Bacteroidia bacterium]
YFIDMVTMLDKLNEHGMKASVEWYYKEGDNDMMLEGQDIQELLNKTEVKLIEY